MDATQQAKLSEWFSQYGRGLVLYAAQWLGREAAEDVVQEVFLRLWASYACEAHASQEPFANVRNWLFRSVRNAAIDRLRNQKRRRQREERRARSRPAWFESQDGDQLEAGLVQDALERLPNSQREIIVLRIWAGLTLAEAAGVTGEPLSTLFSRYRAGLSELKKRLEIHARR